MSVRPNTAAVCTLIELCALQECLLQEASWSTHARPRTFFSEVVAMCLWEGEVQLISEKPPTCFYSFSSYWAPFCLLQLVFSFIFFFILISYSVGRGHERARVSVTSLDRVPVPFKPILLHDTDGYKLLVMRWGPILTLSKKSGEIIVSIYLFIYSKVWQ